MIHTSYRSESSNNSLVVLDKVALCLNATHGRLKSRIYFQSGRQVRKYFPKPITDGVMIEGRKPGRKEKQRKKTKNKSIKIKVRSNTENY